MSRAGSTARQPVTQAGTIQEPEGSMAGLRKCSLELGMRRRTGSTRSFFCRKSGLGDEGSGDSDGYGVRTKRKVVCLPAADHAQKNGKTHPLTLFEK